MKALLTVLLLGLIVTVSLAKSVEDVENEVKDVGGYEKVMKDPCEKKHCGPGHECDIDEDDNPICICRRKCPKELEERAMVCSSHNDTFDSECELHRQHCLCHKNDPDCLNPKFKHAHLDYFGKCTELPKCEEGEMLEYPERLREWLYLVMQELTERKEITGTAAKWAEDAKQDTSDKHWVLPVIWKFCDLDSSHNRLVNTHELLSLSAPLKALEHCTGPFLQQCDDDSDGEISLQEWGRCLGLESGEIEDKCDTLKE
eukprot:GHVU01003558.1.p1 GENE.GHVU01003558.1~~GHVU01003558.1.p1  ORF type:complete len:258 (-),score=37.00 GHVU01003558.1:397-1170(-)